MDFEDRRIGPEERFSGLSEGQRYALALVLNLAFVGVVIAGFAFLYTSGFSGGSRQAEPASATASLRDASDEIRPASEIGVARLADATPAGAAIDLPADSPAAFGEPGEFETAALGPDVVATDALPAGALPPETLEDDDPATALPIAADAAGGPDPAPVDLGAPDEESAADGSFEVAAVDPALTEPAVDAAAGAATVASLGPEPRLAPRETLTDAAPALPPVDPIAAAWSSAGSLAARLQRDFPCSQFSLQADGAGRPSLRARVGYSDDIDLVRTRVAEQLDDISRVEGGLGCTTVIGGGYVALSDENGRVTLFDRNSLSREVRAVLPGEGTCAVVGQVIATQPILRQRLAEAGREATWVRLGGEPALCESTDGGMWQVVSSRDTGDRRAAALVLGDDVIATEARRAANLGPPAAVTASTATTPYDLSAAPATPTTPPRTDGMVEVAPVSGPAPRLPAGVESSEGYAVTIAFTVGADGAPEDLSVTGAGMADVSVVAAALEVVSASRFPEPTNGRPYRAVHTVRFPSAEFSDLLTRLSLATASERNASPVWDRQPTQADYDRHYPARALRRDIEGSAEVDCRIAFDGRLTCSVASETPSAWGFGAAALQLAEGMRAGPRMTDGGPSANEMVTLEFVFTPSGGAQ